MYNISISSIFYFGTLIFLFDARFLAWYVFSCTAMLRFSLKHWIRRTWAPKERAAIIYYVIHLCVYQKTRDCKKTVANGRTISWQWLTATLNMILLEMTWVMSDDIMIALRNAHTYSKSCNRQQLCRLVVLVE